MVLAPHWLLTYLSALFCPPSKVVALPIAFLHWVHTKQGLPHMVQSCFAACVACSPGFPPPSPIPSGIQLLV